MTQKNAPPNEAENPLKTSSDHQPALCPVCHLPVDQSTYAKSEDACQLCEQEQDLEPGTFTPHEHSWWSGGLVNRPVSEALQEVEDVNLQKVPRLTRHAWAAAKELAVEVRRLQAPQKRTLRSATLPRFRFRKLKQRIAALEENIDTLCDGMTEWEEHIANWRFSPEQLAGDLVMAAVLPELREYMAAHPCAEHWPGSQFVITEQWATDFWQWLVAQPVAARILRAARIDATCFQTTSVVQTAEARLEFDDLTRAACLEYVQHRSFEPWEVKDERRREQAERNAQRNIALGGSDEP